jgi:hypothetical protein
MGNLGHGEYFGFRKYLQNQQMFEWSNGKLSKVTQELVMFAVPDVGCQQAMSEA